MFLTVQLDFFGRQYRAFANPLFVMAALHLVLTTAAEAQQRFRKHADFPHKDRSRAAAV